MGRAKQAGAQKSARTRDVQFDESDKRSGKSGQGPRWPDLSAKANLSPVLHKDWQLFTVPGYLTRGECIAFIEQAHVLGFKHVSSKGPEAGEAFRDNESASTVDPALAQRLWDGGLASIFERQVPAVGGRRAVGLDPHIRFYCYNPGQRFDKHIDVSIPHGRGKRTEYTLLVYLSGGPASATKGLPPLEGGETAFYDEQDNIVAEIAPRAGTALLHIHGNRCMGHEARAVTAGTKFVLRSDVVFSES
ncbi:hypothetical protein KFL_000070630 [Klebsormidium nitens]|uniref:Fe2OG dioxygenase domain-containing protein n=1 Tax=Klebsormidium nitens TaxID=105231 RepID=A0A1Y1HNB3_KLENI|nr:hypothetical protein KFL_000070630 [Klebsormidium nitens]|eukprot:GAQ78096.1 hypothetical protein KFL_000070630 [Klebsormidium nitens]